MTKTARKEYPPDTPATETQSPSDTSGQPTQEDIATRAYYIYLERGGASSNPEEDWLQAERELIGTSEPHSDE